MVIKKTMKDNVAMEGINCGRFKLLKIEIKFSGKL
jgi:hypothetical protein